MKKITIITAATLLLVGSAVFHWVINERAKEVQFQSQQVSKYNDRIDMVSQFLSGKIDVQTFSQKAPEAGWEREINSELSYSSRNELAFNISVICLCGGALIVGCWFIYGIAKVLMITVCTIWKLIAKLFKLQKNVVSKSKKKVPGLESVEFHVKYEPEKDSKSSKVIQRQPAKRKWLEFQKEQPMPRQDCLNEVENLFTNQKTAQVNTELVSLNNDAEKITQLFSDMESIQFDNSFVSLQKAVEDKALENNIRKTVVANKEASSKAQERLKTQADLIEKQMSDFKNLTENIKKSPSENTEPIKDTLKSLTEQVSAIREYASIQQERVNRLQDGYDWNIIKTFCMKIIRCIDNLDNRIEMLSAKDDSTTALEEIRDELIFALESSGIETFEPELSSDYCGQEKFAEAIGDRQQNTDPSLKGKIAKVLRKGYQYCIDDDNVKIVRTAQVRLFS